MIIQDLKANLESHLVLLQEFRRLALLKKEALINNELQQLDIITSQEEQLLAQIGIVEKQRLAWANKFGAELGKQPEELTLAELSSRYPELNALYQEFKAITSELQEIHKVNAQLIEQALKIVNFSVGLLTPNEKSTYRRPSEKESVQAKLHLLDQKI